MLSKKDKNSFRCQDRYLQKRKSVSENTRLKAAKEEVKSSFFWWAIGENYNTLDISTKNKMIYIAMCDENQISLIKQEMTWALISGDKIISKFCKYRINNLLRT